MSNPKVHSVEEQEIEARSGEPVQIEMESAGATGYTWQVEADTDRVRVLDHSIEPDIATFGGGGRESFVLEPLIEGKTNVTFKLTAPWEEEPAETRVIQLSAFSS